MLPEQFLYQCSQNKKLKIIDTDRNIFKDVIIHDISLKSHGSDEDKDYQQDEFLFNNVRRGNTVVQVYKNNQLQQSFWGRRGLKKFFDMRVSDIQNELNIKILEPIISCFKQGHVVELYQLEKANGENAQVSYCSNLDCWVIASKNVSLLAFSVEDLEIYGDSRFRFAKLIAQSWFESLKTIPDIESFKYEIDQKTLVGEYCGNSNHQHLIKYNKEQIIWFAITQFDCENSSLDVESSHKFFKKHKLQTVNVKYLGIFNTLPEFTQRYQDYLNEVERSSLNTQQEGAVFYIQDYNDKVVLNLCKAKTLEYRIFRKLREKLKVELKKSSQEKLLASFEKEVKELCKLNQPPMPLKHYLSFAHTAFICINHEPDLKQLFQNQYISFLAKIQEIIDKGIIPQQITGLQVPQTIYAFIPISIPGMGKSSLQTLIAQKTKLICISSDEIRFNLMQKERARSNKICEEELFKKTRFAADKEFDYQVQEALKKREQGNLIIFLDKNHPPNGINKSIELLRKHKPQNCNLIICAITPKCNEPLFMEFPFSANFLAKCIWRIQNRHNHLTLNGSGIQTIGIMMMFISMFNKFKLNESQFDEVFRIDFTNESKPLDLEPHLLELLGNLLGKSNNGNTCVSKLELVHYIETHPIVDQFDDMNEQIQLVLNKIEQ